MNLTILHNQIKDFEFDLHRQSESGTSHKLWIDIGTRLNLSDISYDIWKGTHWLI